METGLHSFQLQVIKIQYHVFLGTLNFPPSLHEEHPRFLECWIIHQTYQPVSELSRLLPLIQWTDVLIFHLFKLFRLFEYHGLEEWISHAVSRHPHQFTGQVILFASLQRLSCLISRSSSVTVRLNGVAAHFQLGLLSAPWKTENFLRVYHLFLSFFLLPYWCSDEVRATAKWLIQL